LRGKFGCHVVRRTGASKDNEGKPLAGIAPAREHVLSLDLYPAEYDFLAEMTEDFQKSDGKKKVKASHQNFYIHTRRGLTHEVCTCGARPKDWICPKTMEEWMRHPSAKLCATGRIASHHLATDNAQPLHCVSERELIPNPDAKVTDRPHGLPRDRIVIYSAFPSSSEVITDVLRVYGVELLEFNGSMSEKAKAESLAEFKSEEDGTRRVMLLSSVGTTGLNLDFANVLIILDTLWSVMDDLQLQGRLKRYPQSKGVEIYRLIAARTADETIQMLSTGKGKIHEKFTSASLAFRE
ncbi:hypothetical protein FIBSPDRAFT_684637, partial [Athelia psychrophila]